jgi:hypothetical protein
MGPYLVTIEQYNNSTGPRQFSVHHLHHLNCYGDRDRRVMNGRGIFGNYRTKTLAVYPTVRTRSATNRASSGESKTP